MMKRIKKIESLNYYLYLIIVLLAGLVFFSVSYFATSKVVEVATQNEVDKSFAIKEITETGFDIEVKSLVEVKVRYLIGVDPEMLTVFYETSDFVRDDFFQYRSQLNGRKHYLQVEFEKRDGSKLQSKIKEISK
jgi:uncharacterized protein (DUF58 family)